ncbi:MAG: tail fiber domain-containing protein, partial [Bacteroidota bacterium]
SGGNNVNLSSLVIDVSGYAPLVSPGFTGIPTAPTAAPGTDSTQMATTAFVAAAITASAGTDLQQLNLVGNTLQLDNGGSVDLSPYLDDTDAQTLNFDAGTQQLSISGGNNVDLSSLAGGGNLTNLEDNGVNVKNAPSGTGYFKWDNVKIDGGGITAPGNIMANDFIATSDMRLKTDSVPIGNYKDIYHLNAYKHGWEHNDEMTFGLMAQEVEQYFPELVKTDTNGHKAMSYMKLVPVMLEAIKDLKEQLNSLKS